MRTFFLFFLLLFPFPVLAQTVDLGFLGNESIFFSTTELIAGTRARVYARIHNFGDVDVTGRVAFKQGTIPLGSSQVISVRAGGAYEEVFVDFTVPESDFNIRAEIVDADPEDTVVDNNIVISTMLEPIPDEDQDGVEDDADNCPSAENADQRDADGDSLGDVCDEDDDNDILTDEVEAEMGSDPESADTDEDGIVDGEDPEPTDAQEAVETEGTDDQENFEEQTTAASVTSAPSDSSVPTPEIQDQAADEQTEALEVEESTSVTTTSVTNQESSFTSSRSTWNTYTFDVPENTPSDATILWTFGDGSSSSKPSVEHTFREPGSYDVSLRITRDGETLYEETTAVRVSFFHFENPSVKLVISILLVLLIVGLSVTFRLRKLAEGRL